MNKIAIVLASLFISCFWFNKEVKPTINGVIDCLKVEKSNIEKELDIVSVVMDVAVAIFDTIRNGGDPSNAIDTLIAKYTPKLGDNAENTIACIVKAYKDTRTTSVERSLIMQEDSIDVLIRKRGWRFAQ